MESAFAAEQRIESEGFGIRDGDSWTLHGDGVCQTLWFRRVKAEKTLAQIEPGSAIGAAQFLCSEEQEPHTLFNWPA